MPKNNVVAPKERVGPMIAKRLVVLGVAATMAWGGTSAPARGAVPNALAAAKFPSACVKYLKGVSASTAAVADAVANLLDAVEPATRMSSAADANDRPAFELAKDELEAYDLANSALVGHANELLAPLKSAGKTNKACKKAKKDIKLPAPCRASMSNSPKYIVALLDSHVSLTDYLKAEKRYANATLDGDAATAQKAREAATSAFAEQESLSEKVTTLQEKLTRSIAACVK